MTLFACKQWQVWRGREHNITIKGRRTPDDRTSVQSRTSTGRVVYQKNSEQSTRRPSTVENESWKSCVPEELRRVNEAPPYSRERVLEELSTKRTQNRQRGTPVQSRTSPGSVVYQKNSEQSTRHTSTVENGFRKSCLPEELLEQSTRRPSTVENESWGVVYQKNPEQSTRRPSTVENELSSLLNSSTRTETESCQPRRWSASKVPSNKCELCSTNSFRNLNSFNSWIPISF